MQSIIRKRLGVRSTQKWFVDHECYAIPVKLLLAEGANPNESCHGLTPWSVLLRGIYSGNDLPGRPSSRYNCDWRQEGLGDKLDIAKPMLQHDADPFLCVQTPRFTITPQIFAELLERDCCSGYALNDCTCANARQIQPISKATGED